MVLGGTPGVDINIAPLWQEGIQPRTATVPLGPIAIGVFGVGRVSLTVGSYQLYDNNGGRRRHALSSRGTPRSSDVPWPSSPS